MSKVPPTVLAVSGLERVDDEYMCFVVTAQNICRHMSVIIGAAVMAENVCTICHVNWEPVLPRGIELLPVASHSVFFCSRGM